MQSVATGGRTTTTLEPRAAPPTAVEPPATERAHRRARLRPDLRRDRYDVLLVIALAVSTVFVHPIDEMLSHPYWLDESWVAVLTKASWADFARMSSSTPLGFVALLRLLPDSGGQRGRLLVLAFSVLTVVATYFLTRALGWKGRGAARCAAVVTALVVMLAPVSLIRFNLKQYTCDAFVAVLLLAVGAWVERKRTRGSLLVLVATAIAAVPFSSTALFVTVAVVVGLFASACLDRSRRRAAEILVGGALAGAGLLGYYAIAIAPNVNEKLRAFWDGQYLGGGVGEMIGAVWTRLGRLDHLLAMPALVFLALFAAGIVVLVRLRARALAIALPVLWVEMMVMGRIERYPFLDQRTSQFLLVPSLIVVALGAIGLVGFVWRVGSRRHAAIGPVLATVCGLTLATLFFVGARGYVRHLSVPFEDIRSQVTAVAERRQPGDVIVVGSATNFGFAYYWPHGDVVFRDDPDAGQGFRAEVAGIGALTLKSRDFSDVVAGLQHAIARLRAAPAGSHLYIVRTHLQLGDYAIWQHAFATLHIAPREDVVGIESLLVLDRSALDGR